MGCGASLAAYKSPPAQVKAAALQAEAPPSVAASHASNDEAAAAMMIQKRTRGAAARKAMRGKRPSMHEVGAFSQRDRQPAGKGSRLYVPSNTPEGPVAAAVLVHGVCVEGEHFANALGMALGIDTFHWTYMVQLAEQLAEQCGIIVLMIGLHDDDEMLQNADLKNQAINGWPSCYYSIFLEAAIIT